eukprot:COSAG06_NODE_702_length_12942_cov_22.841482_11_plen_68_part_00
MYLCGDVNLLTWLARVCACVRNRYYFNFDTGESVWEHPGDEYYRALLAAEREKLRAGGAGAPRPGSA